MLNTVNIIVAQKDVKKGKLISRNPIFSITFLRQIKSFSYRKFFRGRKKGKCAQKFKRGVEKMVVDRGPNGEGKYFGNFLGG